MSVGGAILGFTSRLCMPAAGILGVALLGVLVCRRLLKSVYGAIVGAHIAIMLMIEVTRSVYVNKYLPCMNAVPIHSFFMLSSACWLQCVCLYMVHRLKNTNLQNVADNFVSFLLSMLYSLFTPFVILVFIDGILQGPSIGSKSLVDSKTCLYREGALTRKGEIDATFYLLLSRSVMLSIDSIIFIYLMYNIKKNNRGCLLCARDAGNIFDVLKRQEQALRYVLLILGTYAVETTADLGVWFTKYKQPDIQPPQPYLELIAAERVFKAFSICVDFFRCIFICDIIWCRGPNGGTQNRWTDSRHPHGNESSSDPPSYDEALRQAMLVSSSSSPPTYTSLFGFRSQNIQSIPSNDASDNQEDAIDSSVSVRSNSVSISIVKCFREGEEVSAGAHYPSTNNEDIQ